MHRRAWILGKQWWQRGGGGARACCQHVARSEEATRTGNFLQGGGEIHRNIWPKYGITKNQSGWEQEKPENFSKTVKEQFYFKKQIPESKKIPAGAWECADSWD
jgi:hypothetical protein